MFPNKIENADYDFLKTENYERWKGTFANSLDKVLEQVHPSLNAAEEALLYVEQLILTLMGKLCAKPSPHTIQDVEERVGKTFPNPIDQWAVNDARESMHKAKKKRPVLPVDKIHQMLQKEVFMCKIETLVTTFIVAIVEYIAADILKLAGNYVKKISNNGGYLEISSQDIKTSMNADKALMEMFYQEQVTRKEKGGERALAPPLEPSRTPRASLTYEELVRDLMNDEKQYLRDLHLIIRVFREEIEKILPKDSKDVELIFGNILEIYELTVTLLSSLEDTVESASETQMPHIGICFEELAEAEEFDVYVKYAQTVTMQQSRQALQAIVDNPEYSERLDTAGHGFRLAVKYFLPKLLASPITHAFLYFDYVAMLLKLAPCTEDMESFQQVEGLMKPIQKSLLAALENGPTIEAASRMASRARRQVALEKTNELTKLINNWDWENKDIGLCCNEFIREDILGKGGPGKKITERRGFLFDGILLLCKPCTGDKAKSELKCKERLYIRKAEIIDKPDTDELRNCFELVPKNGSPVFLCCTGAIDKNRWMADLVMLNTKSMLDRTLDSILLDLERKHPLKLPPPSLYRFAVPDSPENIVIEKKQNTGALIKGGTLLKLVERLTYHIYADPMFVKTFLVTYRSFCQPPELLDLLIERFNIPDPSLVYDAPEKAENVVITETEKLSKNSSREDFKRYRKEFLQPVQFRVLNVLRHWVDQHYYDFERDPSLLDKLRAFLDGITGKPMKKWVESVIKIMQRKSGGGETRGAASPSAVPGDSVVGAPVPVFDNVAPPIERFMGWIEPRNWHMLVLHPIEVARQLTLLEFDMYRMVKPSELVGAAWTKKDKETSSPNLLRIMKLTTNFTRWIEKSIVEAENIEERGAILRRTLEIMMVLRELNNFNGVLAIVSAMGSASVFRLKFTFQTLTTSLEKALEECRELITDYFRLYQEKLRSINPPCVPFFGMYLTNILHIEDGNKDFIPNTELINFSKRRKVAEIIGEIQQYQNQPYCLQVEPKLRAFLENLNPFPSMEENEISDYLYRKCLEIEPRDARQAPRFPRRWPELNLKSPGIKPARARQPQHASVNPLGPDASDDLNSSSQLSPTTSTCDQSSVYGSMASLQQSVADEEPPSPRHRFRDHKLPTPASHNRHSSLSSTSTSTFGLTSSSTFSLGRSDHGNSDSISPRLPSTSITELSSRMIDNFSNAPPPVSPRPSSIMQPSKTQEPLAPKSSLISPRLTNPSTSLINKGSNDSSKGSPLPMPPPRGSFPSPDHQMVEFRNPNGPKWPSFSGETSGSFISDLLPRFSGALGHMSSEEKHHKIVNDIISNVSNVTETSPRPAKPVALSPRNPIAEANGSTNPIFHSFDTPVFKYGNNVKPVPSKNNGLIDLSDIERSKPPPLGPRNSLQRSGIDEALMNLEVDRTNKPKGRPNGDVKHIGANSDSEDPPLVKLDDKELLTYGNNTVIGSNNTGTIQSVVDSNRPPTPPERPPALSPRGNNGMNKQGSIDEDSLDNLAKSNHNQSPKIVGGDCFGRLSEPSPKLLPSQIHSDLLPQLPHPPLSPHVNVLNSVQNFERHHGISATAMTFSFPSYSCHTNVSPSWSVQVGPRPSPTTAHSFTATPHTPPPLPPRRVRDSTPAATPAPVTAQSSPTFASLTNVPAVPPRGGSGNSSPPPLPPRPAQLLGPDHSTILQRRHLNNINFSGDSSQTPQLPPKPPSTTVFLTPRVTHARQETQ